MSKTLARPVGAEEAEDLALLDLEVDVHDAAMRAVELGELLGPDDGGHGCSFVLAAPRDLRLYARADEVTDGPARPAGRPVGRVGRRLGRREFRHRPGR